MSRPQTRRAVRLGPWRSSSKTPKSSIPARAAEISRGFWRMLGATTDKVRPVDGRGRRIGSSTKAAGTDDEQLAKAAQLLKLDDLADSRTSRSSWPSPGRLPSRSIGQVPSMFSFSRAADDGR